jgi:hypothetical protein
MTTFVELIDEVSSNMSGYTLQQDRATYLTSDVTTSTSPIDSPTILSVNSTENIGKGIVEIGEELIWVDNYDRVGNTCTVSPFGRGYNGSTATTHSRGDKVTISPTFPRVAIKRAINDTVKAMSSVLYSVGRTEFTYQVPKNTYGFNGLGIRNILSLSWQSTGPTKEWIPIRHWDWDVAADETVFGADAQTVTIGDYITPGRRVKVIYAKDPDYFTSDTQELTDLGYQQSVKDVVILGACYRLTMFLDPARQSMVSPQADETDARRPYGTSNAITKQLFQMYKQRLDEEIIEQQRHYPIRVHYARR